MRSSKLALCASWVCAYGIAVTGCGGGVEPTDGGHEAGADTGAVDAMGGGDATSDTGGGGMDMDVDGGGMDMDVDLGDVDLGDVDLGTDMPMPCGNGVVDPGETCDTGIASGTGACPAGCDDGIACTTDVLGGSACTAACTNTPITATAPGDGCCPSGATHATDTDCPASCGDGTLDTGELCDTGIASGAGSCPTGCDDAMACTTDTLVSAGTCSATCSNTAITTPTNGDGCCPPGATIGTDNDCPRRCGDGVTTAPETCDDGNTTSGDGCSSTCMTEPARCGDGRINGTEQCDDGNTRNLDGCDSTCNYEVISRVITAAISNATSPATCTPTTNRLGRQVLTMTALDQLNPQLQGDIDTGSTNILVQWQGLSDLTGVTDPDGTMIGFMSGALDPAKGAWTGTATMHPIDWWFLINHTAVDSMGHPLGTLSGTLTTRTATAGPGNITFPLALGGSAVNLAMRSARLFATVDAAPAPNVPAPPPAALASGLTVFQSVTGNGSGQGICGNITVESLAQIPAPATLCTGGGIGACGASSGSHTYTYCGMGMPVSATCNSLLDVIVGGCKVLGGFVTVINAYQPDVASGTAVTTLTLGTGNHIPSTTTTGDLDAYSAYLTFTANRAHATGETCTITADCMTGLTCTAGTCG